MCVCEMCDVCVPLAVGGNPVVKTKGDCNSSRFVRLNK